MNFLEFSDYLLAQILLQPFYVKFFIVVSALIFFTCAIVTKVLLQFFVVPPNDWADKIVALLQRPTLKLRSTNKAGSFRRRLVLGSFQPSLYSTTPQIKSLKIAQIDKEYEMQFLTNCKLKAPDDESRKKIYGIFHPYCNAAGGGEKVLWELVNQILIKSDNNIVAIYHGEYATPKEILTNISKLFDLKLNSDRIVFIYLTKRWMIDPKTWPMLTLLGQLVGSVVLALEAVYKMAPDIWVDTVGLPFSYPFIGLSLKIPILTYTHFPVIQSDMLGKLNKKSFYGLVKYVYWFAFLVLYRICGKFVSLALVNSTWTFDHIVNIWRLEEGRIIKCYPVCSPDLLLKLSENVKERQKTIVSLSQFRDEKRQDLIVKEFAKYLSKTDSSKPYHLKLIGSIRSDKDLIKIESLKLLLKECGIKDGQIEFIINCKYEDLLQHLIHSEVGLNAMWNEHFGIVVVEYLTAGLIPLVHASAGPLMDIVVPWSILDKSVALEYNDDTRTGFYFKSEEDPDYKEAFKDVFKDMNECMLQLENLSEIDKLEMRKRGKEIVLNKFTNEIFNTIVTESLTYIDQLEVYYRIDKREKTEQLF